MSGEQSPVVKRLLASPFGYSLRWLDSGLHSATIHVSKSKDVMIVAPTFDESVTRALDIAEDMALHD